MLPSNLIEQIGATVGEETPKAKAKEKTKTVMSGSKSRFNFSADAEQKKEWDKLCKDNGMTFSRGVAVAFDILKVCLEKDIIELTSYGAMFKKNLD